MQFRHFRTANHSQPQHQQQQHQHQQQQQPLQQVEERDGSLIISHPSAGFFSCCSVKLDAIVEFANLHRSLPKNINGTGLFTLYKLREQMNQDITHVFFKHPSASGLPRSIVSKINYNHGHQCVPYSQLDYKHVLPVVQQFFEPSAQIIALVSHFENKYGIDASNCIAVYYRGTDKMTETALDSFDSYYAKLSELLSHSDNRGCKILLQSDVAQFFDYMKAKFRDSPHSANLVIIYEIAPTRSRVMGTHIARSGQPINHSDIKHLLAVVLLISKCKHVICSSGNVSLWIMMYRGHSANVHQSLNLKWLE